MSDEPTKEDYRVFLKIVGGYPPTDDNTIKLKPKHMTNPYILEAVEKAEYTIIQ